MNYLLFSHEKSYHLAASEMLPGLLSLSAIPYAYRHLELAQASPQHCLGHRVIAVLECIPVAGLLFAVIERIVAYFHAHPTVFKVPLVNARQYDIPNDQPAACTFHAVAALEVLSHRFDEVFTWIQMDNRIALSSFQRDLILNEGLPFYRRALGANPQLIEGADFEQIREHLPEDVPLNEVENAQERELFTVRINRLISDLFERNRPLKMAWIKNGNEESFAVIVKKNRAIVFDSHRNEIIGVRGWAETYDVLSDKLDPFANLDNGFEQTPFVYAISN